MKDWYHITWDSFMKAGGGGLYKHYHSMSKLLTSIYPEYPIFMLYLTWCWYHWSLVRFCVPHSVPESYKMTSKRQLLLFEIVKEVSTPLDALHHREIFSGVEVKLNYTMNMFGRMYDVDVFVPIFSLAFEYNGEYHYKKVIMYQYNEHLLAILGYWQLILSNRCSLYTFTSYTQLTVCAST